MKIAKIFILTGIIFLAQSCGSKNIKSVKIEEPVVVDGNGNEWEKYPLAFDEDFNFIYGAVNTEAELYLMFRFNDSRLAHMLSTRGGTIWIGEDKQFGIHYVDENLRDFIFDPSQRNSGRSGRGEPFQPTGTFSVVGIDSIFTPDMDQYPSIRAAFNMHGGLYCFEIKIPFKYKNKNPGDKIEIGFEIAAIDENMKKQMDKQRKEQFGDRLEGMPQGGMRGGGMRGGGRRGSGPPAGNRKMNFDARAVWFEVTLAE